MAQFTNQAQLSYNNTVTTSNIAIGEIIGALTVSKTPVTDAYAQGDSITYVVSLINSAASSLTGLTLTDNLGAYTFDTGILTPLTYTDGSVKLFIDGVLQPSPTVNSDNGLVISGINVPSGASAIIVYEAIANQYAPLTEDGEITNTVTVSGGGITPIEATATVTAINGPLLTITKAISPIPVAENGRVTYTFTIQNMGNTEAVATDNVILTDIFNPILTGITAALNGTAWTEGTEYTYNEADGTFTSTIGAITVPAATYTQDTDTGVWQVTPGTVTLVITGNIS